jgi:D-tyrosyl-tRNA(Tyr) deacylase
MHVVAFFCADLAKDPVAPRVLEALERLFSPGQTPLEVDGLPVSRLAGEAGGRLDLVRTAEVLSHRFDRYLPALREHFGAYDLALHVNWHGGKNAPDRILTVHSIGDVVSGTFAPVDAPLCRRLFLALEHERHAAALDFTVVTEATHWSGIPQGLAAGLIIEYQVPFLDVEIGSTPEAWANPEAAAVVARALARLVHQQPQDGPVRTLMCAGGIHIEPAFAAPLRSGDPEHPLAVAHVLPKHWLAAGGYDGRDGLDKLRSCARSVRGGVHAVVFHDDLKAPFRDQLRRLADELGVPLLKRQALKDVGQLPLW